MTVTDWIAAISVLVAAVAAVFSGLSWWNAKKSGEYAERSAQGVENLARSLDAPQFDVEWTSKNVFVLTNKSGREVTIDKVANREEFLQIDLADGVKLAQWESVRVYVFSAMGAPVPATLVLSCGGSLVHVPLRLGARRAL